MMPAFPEPTPLCMHEDSDPPLIFSADPNFTYTVLNREKFRMETITNRIPDDDLHAQFFVQGAVFD